MGDWGARSGNGFEWTSPTGPNLSSGTCLQTACLAATSGILYAMANPPQGEHPGDCCPWAADCCPIKATVHRLVGHAPSAAPPVAGPAVDTRSPPGPHRPRWPHAALLLIVPEPAAHRIERFGPVPRIQSLARGGGAVPRGTSGVGLVICSARWDPWSSCWPAVLCWPARAVSHRQRARTYRWVE